MTPPTPGKAASRRHQRTFRVDGVRVLVTWRGKGFDRGRVRVTDPGGDCARERRVAALVAAGFAAAFVAEGIGISIGSPRVIPDHEATS